MKRKVAMTAIATLVVGVTFTVAWFIWPGLVRENTSVSGIVMDDVGPVAGALVRIQTTSHFTTTNIKGEFSLADLEKDREVALTAFAPGYYISGPVLAKPGSTDLSLALTRHSTDDNVEYAWLGAFSSAGQEGNCQNCHSDPADPESNLPFDEWQMDAHGNAAVNRRFLSTYNGTNLDGSLRSLETRYAKHKDYGRFPLPPDEDQPYYGPGFKLDFPDQAGNCATCHLPAASVGAPHTTDPNMATGVGLEGVACDLCHKIWDVGLDPANGLPYPNMTGILSINLVRPDAGHQVFVGPFDDVAPGEDTYSPLQDQSQICAPCHFGEFWGTQVYDSFGEWLESPFSDPETGKTCQDCHMPRRGATLVALVDEGGQERDPQTIFSHLMPGAADTALLQDTATVEVNAQRQGDRINLEVRVTNENAGHHIPTDHPARNILLVVSATDSQGGELGYLGDQRIPDWGGTGTDADDYGGRPGKRYAKILEELWTEVAPSVAYWNPTVTREDTRIAALATDVTNYKFAAPSAGPALIEVRLVFRRAFKNLADQKGWNDPDILMEKITISVP
jgi:hypothetical protein